MTERPDDIVGHKTFAEPLTRAEAEGFLVAADKEKAEREKIMPDERAAIRMFSQAWCRLFELGWREAFYCPKDGSSFDVIEAGGTGIYRAHYSGEGPMGTWWIEDAGDLWPSRPLLFRIDPEAEVERKARMEAARERHRADRGGSP